MLPLCLVMSGADFRRVTVPSRLLGLQARLVGLRYHSAWAVPRGQVVWGLAAGFVAVVFTLPLAWPWSARLFLQPFPDGTCQWPAVVLRLARGGL